MTKVPLGLTASRKTKKSQYPTDSLGSFHENPGVSTFEIAWGQFVKSGGSVQLKSGSTLGVTDNQLIRLSGAHLGSVLESRGISWKVYAEDYLGSCSLFESSGDFYRYRVPFLSFQDIQSNRFLCSKVVGYGFLRSDLRLGSLPVVSVVVPSLKHRSLSRERDQIQSILGSLKEIIDPLREQGFFTDNAVVITTINTLDPKKGNQLFTLFLGNHGMNASEVKDWNHYSTLNWVRRRYGFSPLGNAAQ